MKYCGYLRKIYLISLKYLPLVQTLVLIFYILLPDLGQFKYILELIFGCSIISGIRIAAASKVLGFCYLHRIIIFYNCYSYIIIKLRQIFGVVTIFKILKPFHIILGILLLLYALIDKVILKHNIKYNQFKSNIKLIKHKNNLLIINKLWHK